MLVPQYQNEDFGLRPELCFQRKQRYRSVAKRKIEILDFIGFLEKRNIFLSKYYEIRGSNWLPMFYTPIFLLRRFLLGFLTY